MNISGKIKNRRTELGISADSLGEKIGKDRSTIYRYESGDIDNISIDTLIQLSDALDTTPDFFLKNDNTTTNIGTVIFNARLKLGITQEELARLVGYGTKSAINKIEKGLRDVPRYKVKQFAQVLGIDAEELLGCGEGNINEANCTVGERIRSLRITNDMTLEQVASIVGVGKSTVRKWETGLITNMGTDKIKPLAKALNTTPEFIMGLVDESGSLDESASNDDCSAARNREIFARNLCRQMEIAGKSRVDVSKALGFSYYTYSDWVLGKKYPRMDKVEMLAKYFGCSKSDLIEEETSNQVKEERVLNPYVKEIIDACQDDIDLAADIVRIIRRIKNK